jgi:hypothetical protein
MAKASSKSGQIYQLEIWLMDIEPRIWRKFELRSDIRLDRLHDIIQQVMGWTDSHLHSFNAGDGTEYGMPDPDDMFDNNDMLDEKKAKLTDLLARPKDRFIYVYDFGDNWEHVVELAEIKEAEPGVKYPLCLAGERACPPDDCGGAWAYEDFLKTLRGRNKKKRQELLDWLGYDFDPEAFDIEEINKSLKTS